MINFDEKEFRAIVQKIIRKHGFGVNSEIILSKGSNKGDGYLGEIVGILVKDKLNTLNLIAKIAIKNEKVRATFPYSETFKNEILLYEKIIPAFINIQHEANFLSIFKPTAKFFSASSELNQEYLILEDLKTSDFELLDLKNLLSHEYAKIICETYGKFHGVSFAMKTLKNETFFELTSQLVDIIEKLVQENNAGEEYPKIWKYIQKVMRDRGFECEHLKNYANNSLQILHNMCNIGEEEFYCLLHGDCWSNNLMFRHKNYKGNKEVEEIKLLDWQACRLGPPVYDLSYALYSGAPKEVLENLETYLKIYHDSLSEILHQFKLDVNTVYPFKELKRQWKKYYSFGAILSGLIWKFRSFEEHQKIDPLNFKSDDGSTHINAISTLDCDTEYLYVHIKDLAHHLEDIDEGKILN